LARRPCGGIVRILRRLSEPPGGRRWPPEGGSASLEAMGGGVHDGIGALPDGIGLCPLPTMPARAGHGGGTVELARRPCGGIVRILRRLSEPPGGHRWPPEGGSAPPEARGVARRNRALLAHDRARKGWARWGARLNRGVARRKRASPARDRAPARAGNGGTGSPPVRGHRQNFMKALRAAGRPPVASGGWPDLSGGHDRRGVRRNRGVARRNRALPLATVHGGTGSPPVRRHRQNFTKALPAAWRPCPPPCPALAWPGLSGTGNAPIPSGRPAAHGLQRGRATLRRPPVGCTTE